jgi:Cu(I)/Ag(I) efflux system periplasmic protein CusF
MIKHALWHTGLATALALSLTTAASAQATDPHHGHGSPAAATPAPDSAPGTNALPWSEAEVRRVDARGGKVTLRHGEIKNLDMPPMTMVFQVREPALLEQVKAGDKVRFTADQVNGAYTVLSLERVQ